MQDPNEVSSYQEQVSKPILLGLTAAIVIGVIAPLIAPHVTHPTMVYHVLLHLASVTIAAFLGIVSLLAYNRVKTIRIFLMTIGFMALTVSEFLYFLDVAGIVTSVHVPGVNADISHVILLGMLGLFGVGVLKAGGIKQ